MFGLYLGRKSLVTKYGRAARNMITNYGDGAEDRARSRAEQCRRGSRDFKHWNAMARTIAFINEEQGG